MDMFDVMLGSKLGGGGGGEAENYNDLTGLPQINGVELKGNKSTAQLLISFTASDVGALPDSTKYAAAVALSIDQSTYVVTAQLKDQDGNNIGSASTVDLPLETMVVGGSYDAQNQKIVLTLKDGSTTDIAIGALISGLQPELVVGTNLDDTPTSGSTNPVTSGGVWSPMAELIDSGAKNIANWTASTSTINNVSFAVSGDTVTVSLTSGTTASARSQKSLSVTFRSDLPSGTYVLSGAPALTAGGLYLWDQTANARVTPTSDTGSGTTFTFNYDPTHMYNLTVDVANGYTIPTGTSLVFKPMICSKAQWDISHTFEPYVPTNAELNAQKTTVDEVYGLGTLIPNGSDLDDYTTPGSYYVTNNANANTITNKPIGGSGFRLIVRYVSAANRPRQEFIKPNQPESIYVRNVSTDGNWTNWFLFSGTEITPAQSQSLSPSLSQLNLGLEETGLNVEPNGEEESR